VLGQPLVEEAERVGEALSRERLEAPVAAVAGEVRGGLAAAVEDEDGAGVEAGAVVGGGGVGEVVGDEADPSGVEPGQHGGEEERRPLGVDAAQLLPGVAGLLLGADQRRVVGVGDGVELARLEPRLAQAPAGGELGQLPGREGDRRLAVLAPAQPLLFGGGDDLAVEDEGCRAVVEDGVDPEDRGHRLVSGVVRFAAPIRFSQVGRARRAARLACVWPEPVAPRIGTRERRFSGW
jgi:hypothetical protein